MRIRIELNEQYAQKLLSDIDFQSKLTFVYNLDGYITEIWVINRVIGCTQYDFKVMTMQMIKNHFCRIINLPFESVDIAFEENEMAKELIRLNTTDSFRKIATIIDFKTTEL